MYRGMLDTLNSHDVYAKSPKSWYVTPVQCDCIWYDLIVNPPEGLCELRPIKEYLHCLKQRVEESLEKRFIYMYGTRKKLRFDTKKPLSTSLFSRKTCVNVLVGRNARRQSIPCDLSPLGVTDLSRHHVRATDKFLSLSPNGEQWITISIHDFMQELAADTGHSTEIHYVGLTRNPHDRPLGRNHRGYSDMVYGLGSEDNDFFLYVTLFKVMAKAEHGSSGFHFLVANSMVDEVCVQKEGELIEGALIAYFDSKYQDERGASERAKLEAQLRRLRRDKNIQSIVLDFELENPSSYHRLGSRVRPPNFRHVFRCGLLDDKAFITALPASFDAVAEFSWHQ